MPVRYKAVEVTAPRVFKVVEREQTERRQSKVRISVEAFNCFEGVRGPTKVVARDPQLSKLVNGPPPNYPNDPKW